MNKKQNKLGVNITKERFHLNNVKTNIETKLLQIAKDKGVDLSNYIVDIKEEIETIYNIINQEKDFVVGVLNDVELNQSKENLEVGSIHISEKGIYLISLQCSVQTLRSGLINYIQYIIGNNESFNSSLLNITTEKGNMETMLITTIMKVDEPTTYKLNINIGFSNGMYMFNAKTSKLNAIKL